MAELTPSRVQILAPITGVDQQVGAAAGTYWHPLNPVKPFTERTVGRVLFMPSLANGNPIKISRKAGAGTSVITLYPGQPFEFIAYNPGERYRLGDFYVTTVGAETCEVMYELR